MSALTKQLRVLVNEDVEDSLFIDSELDTVLTAQSGSLNKAAAHIWRVKAGRLADLVNISEGNSNRAWSNAYKQALDMAAMYEKLAGEESPTSGRPTAVSRKIIRT